VCGPGAKGKAAPLATGVPSTVAVSPFNTHGEPAATEAGVHEIVNVSGFAGSAAVAARPVGPKSWVAGSQTGGGGAGGPLTGAEPTEAALFTAP
jgi:hypothetical protein